MFDLHRELKFYKCQESPDHLRFVIRDVFGRSFSGWTVDGLMCEPDEAKAFCREVRLTVRAPGLPDRVIMKTLLNIRKNWDRKLREDRVPMDGSLPRRPR